jgi:hypothetical protein
MEVDQILRERGSQYGTFCEVALVAQNIKSAMRHSPNWKRLPADMREALEMIAAKSARILCGSPAHFDSWRDIEGYAKLISERLVSSHGTSED